MEFKLPRRRDESIGMYALRRSMHALGWKTFRIGASKYGATGLPDLYCVHPKHGQRWIEMKSPTGKLTKRQQSVCVEFSNAKVGVWVLVNENDYSNLFREPNWWKYV